MRQTLKTFIRKLTYDATAATLPLRYMVCGRHLPVHIPMDEEEATDMLASIRPDKGQSCLCSNEIHATHDLHIIIPVYNTAQYVTDCLRSVFGQETRYSFFVSIVDDGCTDASPSLIRDFVESAEHNVRRLSTEILRQENLGPAEARNKALADIRGRYIMFVDSDDMLLPGAVESLMNAATASDADIAEGNYDLGTCHGMACGKIYRSELFRGVRFPPGYWFEDTLNIFFLYPLSRKTVSVGGRHYFYRRRQGSITHSYHGNARAIDSLWVSRRVLTDFFSAGNHATLRLLGDYLQDILSTVSHFRTLKNEEAMQALFVIHCHIFHRHFARIQSEAQVMSCLTHAQRHLARSLEERNYRHFRIIANAMPA